jgi:hypothetical protein
MTRAQASGNYHRHSDSPESIAARADRFGGISTPSRPAPSRPAREDQRCVRSASGSCAKTFQPTGSARSRLGTCSEQPCRIQGEPLLQRPWRGSGTVSGDSQARARGSGRHSGQGVSLACGQCRPHPARRAQSTAATSATVRRPPPARPQDSVPPPPKRARHRPREHTARDATGPIGWGPDVGTTRTGALRVQ